MPIRTTLVAVLLVVAACRNENPSQGAQSRQHFFAVVGALADADSLDARFKSLGITDQDVIDYCRSIQDPAVRAKFIYTITRRAENFSEEGKPGYWASIRYEMAKFVEVVSMLKEDEHKSFLDIGCGNGEKLFAAMCLGFDKTYGLEYTPKSVELSKKFLAAYISKGQTEITQGDALEIDTKYYAQPDFIYLYSPMKDNEAMARMFGRALSGLKDGGILLEVRLVYYKELALHTRLRIPQHGGWLAIKKEKGKLFYKNSIRHYDWYELESY